MSTPTRTTDTCFAPAARADRAVVLRAAADLAQVPLVRSLLECVPAFAAVLNRERQIVAANQPLVELLEGESADEFLGCRPGEAFECVHHAAGPAGCGTSEACRYCGAVEAVLQCQATGTKIVRECRLRRRRQDLEASLDLRVQVQPLPGTDRDELLLYVTDISGDKRREVLERTFFHDVMNTIGGLRGLVEVLDDPYLDPSTSDRCRAALSDLCGQLIDEVQSQRHLLAAEAGSLQVNLQDEPVLNLVADVLKAYRHAALADARQLVVEPGPLTVLRTDAVLLRRALGNLVKNALEATPPGGRVRLGWRQENGRLEFAVHNDGAMSDEVRRQIFQRSFTTKDGVGRGVGTYSVRLFCEGYLGGMVGFRSTAAEGTTFTIGFPT